MKQLSFKVIDSTEERIDKWIASNSQELSRNEIQNLILAQKVTVNSLPCNKKTRLKAGDEIKILIDEKQEEILPEKFSLDIVYEDDDLLVVNKPKGIVTHPATSHMSGTLVNFLLYHCGDKLSNLNGELRPGIIHRLDKDTSGLLIVAKNNFAHEELAKQIADHSFDRFYEAVVYGHFKDQKGIVDAPIGRSPKDRKKMAVVYENSKNAITHYEVLEELKDFSHIRCQLMTGRTHQIRVHMAYLGHPVAGDEMYGPKKVITKLNGQCLHAKAIGFVHPRSKQYMFFESDLPNYFTDFLKGLK